MNMHSERKYVLVIRKTRLEQLIERFNTWPQAKFYLEHNGADVGDYLVEHNQYRDQIRDAEVMLRQLGPFQKLERGFLPSYQFLPSDIVVVIGQDGLVANCLKYLKGQPVIGVNPDPSRWDGELLPFCVDELEEVVYRTVEDHVSISEVTFAEAVTNTGQKILAVNDLFIGPKTHTSARYELCWDGEREVQSSSGIIVSTGFGSTGWFQSILAGALGVAGQKHHPLESGFAWDDKRLRFTVREPFPSHTTGTSLVFGDVTETKTLRLESFMPEQGVIFSDGVESDSIAFNSGCIVDIGISDQCGRLVVGL